MRRATACLLALVLPLLGPGELRSAASPEQTSKAAKATDLLKESGKLILAKKYTEAVPLVEQAQEILVELRGGNADAKKLAASLEARINPARRVLDKAGIKLAESAKPGTPGDSSVSFTKEIAPILVSRCNNCHISQTRGGFSMANFSALMKGSASGSVLSPGKSQGSRLIDVLDSGDMPRGGGKLPDNQIALIAKWIDQGAKFDGRDPAANISAGLPTPAATPELKVSQATGNESVLFSRDIAPVLAEHCAGCHGPDQPRARLGLDTMRRLLAGSENGPVLTPGKGAESLIVKKLKGQAGDRMPLNRPALKDEVIAKVEKWVSEGAKFDGWDASMNVDTLARTYRATVMTHDELAAERALAAAKNWQLANPGDRPDKTESSNFLVMGSVSEDELAEVKRLAELQQPKVARLLRGPTSGPLVKGRITFFVFRKRYDYSELGRMAESRELPPNSHGHWRFNVIDAYAGILLPEGKEASLSGLVTEQLAGVYLDSLSKEGRLPEWFSQGTAAAVVASLEPKDPRISQWEGFAGRALASSNKPDDFLSGSLPQAEAAAARYSFCKFLMSNNKAFNSLLASLKDKLDFNDAFSKAYGAEPKALAPLWAAKVAAGAK